MVRALNKNQILILQSIDHNPISLSFVLASISKDFNIPLSTLKLNARILRNLRLIDFGNSSDFKKPFVTEMGKLIIGLISTNRSDTNDERTIR